MTSPETTRGEAVPRKLWKKPLAVLPVVGVALVPKVICPLCWPAYAGLLSVLGIPFLPTARFMLPATVAVLVLAVGILAWRARRQGVGPLLLGCVGASVLLVGRFTVDSQIALSLGVVVLVAAFVWDAWRRSRQQPCPACVSALVPNEELVETRIENVSS